ncbi:MAG: fatty acid desaturase [Alphaproteobacteria bacterium]|nr:fatty acid desaturase [Alphaproteobacteria bacterium]
MQTFEATFEAATPPAAADLRSLLARSDRKGLERLAIHLLLIALSSAAIHAAGPSLLAIPAMVAQGILIAYLFAPLHEGMHYTAFANRRVNEIVSWLSGVAIVWSGSLFRYFHLAHHRYIQDPARDPELASPKPTNVRQYLWRLSGLEYLKANIGAMLSVAAGRFAKMPYIPESARGRVRGSVLAQLAIYAVVAGVAVWYPGPVMRYWALPVLLGYPFLLLVLMPEHAGCAQNGDNYANTRTTYTWWPLRLIFWNMSYHAEHHVNPAIPFHALPAAHALLKPKIAHIQPGFAAWNLSYVRGLRAS